MSASAKATSSRAADAAASGTRGTPFGIKAKAAGLSAPSRSAPVNTATASSAAGSPLARLFGGRSKAEPIARGERMQSATSPREQRQRTAAVSAGGQMALRSTVSAALTHSAVVRRAQAELQGATVDVKIAYSGYQPELQSSAGVGTEDTYDYRVAVAQPLYDWGRTGADVERAKAELVAAEANLADVAEKAALEAVQAHIEVLRSQDLVNAAQDNLEVHKRFTQLAVDRTSGGVGDATEVELAGVHQGEAESVVANVQGALRNANSVYQSRVGAAPRAVSSIPELPLDMGRGNSLEAATKNAPAVVAARARGDAARSAATVQKADLLPKLSAEAYVRGDNGSNDPRTGLGVRVTGPTLNGLANFGRVEAANLQAESAEWAAEAARRDATLQAEALFNNEPTLRRRISILAEQIKKARALRELYEDQFKIGERSIADLANVQGDIFRIEREIIAARYDILDLQYSAAAALGYLMDSLQVNLKGPE